MPQSNPPSLLLAAMGFVLILLIFGCCAVWAAMDRRWRRRQSVLPYEPRRRVPWGAVDVVLLILLYLFSPLFVLKASQPWFDVPAAPAVQSGEKPPLDNIHPLARVLLESRGNAWPILLCMFSAIVAAPIVEEFVFRLLLQGWLESVERRFRRQIPWLRKEVLGLVPVTAVSLLFASIHIRESSARIALPTIVFFLGVQAVASVLTVVLSACWLKFVSGATLADFGIVPAKLAADIRLGLLAFLAVLPPIYAAMIGLKILLPEISGIDPVFLLPLAAVLGFLYFRTHRIVPSVALHTAFNAVGVLMALAAAQ